VSRFLHELLLTYLAVKLSKYVFTKVEMRVPMRIIDTFRLTVLIRQSVLIFCVKV